jgi:(2Fe-2S) ferredoxin
MTVQRVFLTVQIPMRYRSGIRYRSLEHPKVNRVVRKTHRTAQAVEEGLGHALNPDMQFVIAGWNSAKQD